MDPDGLWLLVCGCVHILRRLRNTRTGIVTRIAGGPWVSGPVLPVGGSVCGAACGVALGSILPNSMAPLSGDRDDWADPECPQDSIYPDLSKHIIARRTELNPTKAKM